MGGIAVVTGANSGIGLATALRLAADGYDVFAGSRGDAGLEAIAQAASGAGSERVTPLRIDVTSDESVATAFEEIGAAGPVAVLVNNAGISGASALEHTDIATYQAMFDTNLLGVVRCTQAALPGMRAERSGRIVNISSASAVFGPALMSAYAMTKWGLEGLSEALQGEVGPHGIRVVVVRPGTILTPIWGKAGALDPDEDYRASQEYLTAVVTHNLTTSAVPPEAVAEVISAAVADPSPSLRHDVGDTDVMHRLRAQGDDALFDAFFLQGDEFRRRYTELSGIDYWP
jgi:NAD(P)-dependent dehydrogenase (short-subunit alcohol dehydrogenase family)